jgi:predicted nuclease with TOPRIM domain
MTRLLLFLVLALTAAAGCGGDEDDATTDFVADANRVCREGEERLQQVTREQQEAAGELDSLEKQQAAVAEALEKTAAAYEPYMERLRRLEPPAELEQGWTSFLDGVGRAFGLIPELADATRAGDRNRLRELSEEFTRIARETRPFAEQHGLDDCLPDESG